jgi:hypothetical protein
MGPQRNVVYVLTGVVLRNMPRKTAGLGGGQH